MTGVHEKDNAYMVKSHMLDVSAKLRTLELRTSRFGNIKTLPDTSSRLRSNNQTLIVLLSAVT